MSVQDPLLGEWADKMSCGAMSELSLGHYENNVGNHLRGFAEPPCEHMWGFKDVREEHLLQKGGPMKRNMCVEKLPAYQRGPWETAFKAPVEPPVRFDQWTRARTGPCNPPVPDQSCDCDRKYI
jgi:hypothetical protein